MNRPLENVRMVQRGSWTYSGQRDRKSDTYYIRHCNLAKNGEVEKTTGPHCQAEFTDLMNGFAGSLNKELLKQEA